MEKLALALLLIICSMAMVHAIDQDPNSVLEWVKQMNPNNEILTTLHFYFHDTVSGPKPTAVSVNQPGVGSSGPTNPFGSIYVVDDVLTEQPDSSSKVIGQAQGIYGSASMEELGLLMTLNFVFTDGDYKGSTLSVLGRNPVLETYREMPIVGGSGFFRMARGVATANTYSSTPTGDAIVEYNVFVKHY